MPDNQEMEEGGASSPCSSQVHAETQTDFPACCGSYIITLLRDMDSLKTMLQEAGRADATAPESQPEVKAELEEEATESSEQSASESGTDAKPETHCEELKEEKVFSDVTIKEEPMEYTSSQDPEDNSQYADHATETIMSANKEVKAGTAAAASQQKVLRTLACSTMETWTCGEEVDVKVKDDAIDLETRIPDGKKKCSQEKFICEIGTETGQICSEGSVVGAVTSHRLSGRHFACRIPPTDKKEKPTRVCKACSEKAKFQTGKCVRKETSWWCADCEAALCVPDCFRLYHTAAIYATQ